LALAARVDVTPAQVARAWALAVSPKMLVIPGRSSRRHLREDLTAGSINLDADAVRSLSSEGSRPK
jgi:aryl-alcohol dehydrogenase-like predicted oxidoreductase